MAGLLNNLSFVLVLATAKSVLEGGTAVVFMCNVVPGLLIKLTAPYWFDKITYGVRLSAAGMSMMCGILMLSWTFFVNNGNSKSLIFLIALAGVSLVSLQCGLGEASLLALAGQWDHELDEKQQQQEEDRNVDHDDMTGPAFRDLPSNTSRDGCESLEAESPSQEQTNDTPASTNSTSSTTKGVHLTAWSAGTGLAGPCGFAWKIVFNEWLGLALAKTLLLSTSLAVLYGYVCYHIVALHSERQRQRQQANPEDDVEVRCINADNEAPAMIVEQQQQQQQDDLGDNAFADGETDHTNDVDNDDSANTLTLPAEWSVRERWHHTLALWRYIVPLFTVYAAEYACQAGAWTAMGFPVKNAIQRNAFYEHANALYQAGVFCSRSSGTWFTVNLTTLWCLPGLQVVNLFFFTATAVYDETEVWWYRPTILYFICFYTGLLGGAVYVHGYKRIVADFGPLDARIATVRHRCRDKKQTTLTEFALSTTSVAESMGIVCANIISLSLQSCLYTVHDLAGAVVGCPITSHHQ